MHVLIQRGFNSTILMTLPLKPLSYLEPLFINNEIETFQTAVVWKGQSTFSVSSFKLFLPKYSICHPLEVFPKITTFSDTANIVHIQCQQLINDNSMMTKSKLYLFDFKPGSYKSQNSPFILTNT